MRLMLLVLMLLSQATLFSQQPVELKPGGGGAYDFQPGDEISDSDRAKIIGMLRSNTRKLMEQGIDLKTLSPQAVSFSWPLRKAAGFTDNGYYGISNYVDHNPAFPSQVKDYNCGTRTYDQSSGYNHKGTDIFTWPFPWQKMATNAVEVIAAANGIIIGKTDGNPDKSCALCSGCNWNAVYIQHADGSVAWYGHLKTASLTTKSIGQSVTTGEYLGIVGSSGNSTGPHLHFEVYTNSTYTQLIDPYAGSCNSMNGTTSWWATQEAYRVSTLNAVMTHSAAPANGCSTNESVNAKSAFMPGEQVFLGSFYRDQLAGQVSTHTIYMPDNTVFSTWNQTASTSYNASWWWYNRTLPMTPLGTWRYEVAYNGQLVSTNFTVGNLAAGTPVIDAVEKFSIGPVPSTGIYNMQFKLTKPKAVSISVFDMHGKKLMINNYQVHSGSFSYPLDLSAFPDGNYLLRINVGSAFFVKKIVKSE